MDSHHPRRRRSDAHPVPAAAAPEAAAQQARHRLPMRLIRGCVAAALALAVSVALLLFFVLCTLAQLGAHEA